MYTQDLYTVDSVDYRQMHNKIQSKRKTSTLLQPLRRALPPINKLASTLSKRYTHCSSPIHTHPLPAHTSPPPHILAPPRSLLRAHHHILAPSLSCDTLRLPPNIGAHTRPYLWHASARTGAAWCACVWLRDSAHTSSLLSLALRRELRDHLSP